MRQETKARATRTAPTEFVTDAYTAEVLLLHDWFAASLEALPKLAGVLDVPPLVLTVADYRRGVVALPEPYFSLVMAARFEWAEKRKYLLNEKQLNIGFFSAARRLEKLEVNLGRP